MKKLLLTLLIAFNANAITGEELVEYKEVSIELRDSVSDLIGKLCYSHGINPDECKSMVNDTYESGYKLGVMEQIYNREQGKK